MAGTYRRDSCHWTNLASSMRRSISASITLCRRLAWLAATTCFRSSTLYAYSPGTSLTLASTLRGTDMSISISLVSPAAHTPASSSSFVTMQPVADVDVNAKSVSSSEGQNSSISLISTSKSGYSPASSSARGRERLSSVILVTPCEARCVKSSLDILPAPTTVTRSSGNGLPRSTIALRIASSTAADEMETAPLAISVSERIYFPAMTAEFSRRPITLPALPAMSSSSLEGGAMACV
mmetsp:Transcript_40463/g.81089  ORF Transcript_40463/g.81089 Transcript_40463/m.81089 type:complete len:238 (-) Transcript_40463:630-1343(-)